MQKPVFVYLLFRSEDDADGLDACRSVAVPDLIPTTNAFLRNSLLMACNLT